jgi:predicted RNA binding protein YcfA (HicA-like mRNA interferase family)
MTKYTRSVKERIRIARQFGYELKRMKNHLVFEHSNGYVVVCPVTTSCQRSVKNFITNLKRGVTFKKVS